MKNRHNPRSLRHEGRHWLCCALVLLALLPLFLPVQARADIGPKPSVQISFTKTQYLNGSRYYGTLLSKNGEVMGPFYPWSEDWEADWTWWNESETPVPEDVARALQSYQDSDGYQLLNWCQLCSPEDRLAWTYYPPEDFKLLLYFPEESLFCVSPAYEKYAYDSYYTANLARYDSGTVTLERDYPYGDELASLAVRVALTLAAEMALALLFGYRERRLLGFIALVNGITQLFLNGALNVMDYTIGIAPGTFQILSFYALELAVLAAEAVLYAMLLPRFSERPQSRGKAVVYAVLANVLSCALGLKLAAWLPGLF